MTGSNGGDAPSATELERLLDWWYGPPTRSLDAPGGGPRSALTRWHWEQSRRDTPLATQNRVLDERAAWVDGDMLVVYVENQAVWLWGVATTPDDDPEVFERENEPGRAWTPTGERLGEFLLHVAYVEAVLGAPASRFNNDATPAQVTTLAGLMQPVNAKSWRWPGPEHTLWGARRALAFTCRNTAPDASPQPDDPHMIMVAAPDPSGLSFLDDAAIGLEVAP